MNLINDKNNDSFVKFNKNMSYNIRKTKYNPLPPIESSGTKEINTNENEKSENNQTSQANINNEQDNNYNEQSDNNQNRNDYGRNGNFINNNKFESNLNILDNFSNFVLKKK